MSKSIKEVVQDSVAPLRNNEGIDARIQATNGLRELSSSDRDNLALESLTKRITDAAKRMNAAAEKKLGAATSDLFEGLPLAVPIDIDGRRIKPVAMMSKSEAEWVIATREAQIRADTQSVRKFRRMYVRALPIWKISPDKTWGECLLAVTASEAKAATREAA